MIDVKELTDIELNRAMIWLYFDHVVSFVEDLAGVSLSNYCDHTKSLNDDGARYSVECQEWTYLVDFIGGYLSWDLTMPLAVDNGLRVGFYTDGVTTAFDPDRRTSYSENQNPLRAICEVLVKLNWSKSNDN